MNDTREPWPKTGGELVAVRNAERSGVPFLIWRDAEDRLRILSLTLEVGQVTVGRRENSVVAFSWDHEVSRLHAVLEPVDDEWILVDDGLSSNGSWVNGNRVQGRQRLRNRDRMRFGNTFARYLSPPHETSPTTTRADESPGSFPLTEQRRLVLTALCRPVFETRSATPATNPQIADEVHLSIDAVKSHLRKLFDNYGLSDLPQNEKRARLVALVRERGDLKPRDF